MAATVAGLQTRCPEFAGTADATIELALADALAQLNTDAWSSDQADLAQLYLAAHILKTWTLWATDASAVPAGPVTSVKAGDLSKNYAAGGGSLSPEDAALASTAYGREFLRIREMGFASRIMGSTS